MSTTLLRSSCLCLSNGSTLWEGTGWAPGTFCGTWFVLGGNSRVTVTLVLFSLRMFPLLLFQGVSPVCCSCSRSIARPSCGQILGSSSGLPMGLVLAWGCPLPLPPLPTVLSLWGMVAQNCCLLHWMNQYKIVGWCFYQYSGGSSKWCCLPKRLVDLAQCLTEYKLTPDLLIHLLWVVVS